MSLRDVHIVLCNVHMLLHCTQCEPHRDCDCATVSQCLLVQDPGMSGALVHFSTIQYLTLGHVKADRA